jgi:Autotransporter beta-domain
MTTTPFQDKDWKGKRLAITRNYRSLKDTTLGNHPSSITMTDSDDAVLLFGKEDWDGGVMYFRGVRKVASLGDLSAGLQVGVYAGGQWGRIGFRSRLAYTWNSVDADRTVAFQGFEDPVSADFDARTAQIFGEVGTVPTPPSWRSSPTPASPMSTWRRMASTSSGATPRSRPRRRRAAPPSARSASASPGRWTSKAPRGSSAPTSAGATPSATSRPR